MYMIVLRCRLRNEYIHGQAVRGVGGFQLLSAPSLFDFPWHRLHSFCWTLCPRHFFTLPVLVLFRGGCQHVIDTQEYASHGGDEEADPKEE